VHDKNVQNPLRISGNDVVALKQGVNDFADTDRRALLQQKAHELDVVVAACDHERRALLGIHVIHRHFLF
jgi:hypothetical protein